MRGFIYIMANDAMPGLVKIGFSMKDPQIRALDLSGTSVPLPFKVHYDALVDSPFDVEQSIHASLRERGKSSGKEFFALSCDEAVSEVRQFLFDKAIQPIAESARTYQCAACKLWTLSVDCSCTLKATHRFSEALRALELGNWEDGKAELFAVAASGNTAARFEATLVCIHESVPERNDWIRRSLQYAAEASDAGYLPATLWLERVYSGKVFGSIWEPERALTYRTRLETSERTSRSRDAAVGEFGDEESEVADSYTMVSILLGNSGWK